MDQLKHKEILKKLDFNKRLLPLLSHILLDTFILGASYFLIRFENLAAYLFSQILFSVFFFRAFGIMHEAVHYNLSNNKFFNNVLGVLYGSFCFLPFLNWRKIHQQHHLWSGNLDKDPVMKIVLEYPKMSKNKKSLWNRLWYFWIPYLAFLQNIVFWKASFAHAVSDDKLRKKSMYSVSLIPPSAFLIFVLSSPLWSTHLLGLLPSLIIYLSLVEIINFPHHLEMDYIYGNSRLSYKDQYQVSRTCTYSHFFEKYIVVNFNYHTEHHIFPNLPWYELPNAHTLVKEALGEKMQLVNNHDWIIEAHTKDLSMIFRKQKNPTKPLSKIAS